MRTDIKTLITNADQLSVGDEVVLITYNSNEPTNVSYAAVTRLLKTKMTLRFEHTGANNTVTPNNTVTTEDVEYSTRLDYGSLTRYEHRNDHNSLSRINTKLYAVKPATQRLAAWAESSITARETRYKLIDAVGQLNIKHGGHSLEDLREIKKLTQQIIDAETTANRIEKEALRH